VVVALLTRRFAVGAHVDEDLTPHGLWKAPEIAVPIEREHQPVMVTVDYRIDPAQADAFIEVMRESRRIRLRNGALSWELFRDPVDPRRWVEYFTSPSWIEFQRQQERLSAYDIAVRDRKWGFHVGESPPLVTRLVAEPIERR
jgi:quinol monooxygenase YgiN